MSHDEEVFQFFQDHFGPISNSSNAKLQRSYPILLSLFWDRFHFGSRKDGFIWILNPESFTWINNLFRLNSSLIVFARNSFGDIYFVDNSGSLYFFSPSYRNLEKITSSFYSTFMSIADRDFTDEEVLYNRHKELWGNGIRIDSQTCYCFSPAIPIGGNEETSEIYIGDFHTYLELLSQM